ncbi:MAG: hypothetical protein Q9223_001427 [Gallowayella weberi]
MASPSSTFSLSSGALSTSSLLASFTPPSIITSSPAAPANTPASSTNNTGTIVGGVLGGLGFIGFLVFAILVLRRLKSFRANSTPASSSFWRTQTKKSEMSQDHGSAGAHLQREMTKPIEVSGERPPTELPDGRQYETPELYSHHSEAIRN